MKIENQEENQRNMDAIRERLLRSGISDSVFMTMLNKYDHIGTDVRFPPIEIAGFDIIDFEARMKYSDWTHKFADQLKDVLRGEKEINLLIKHLELLAATPEGNRVAFYLCDRWMPEQFYSMPKFIQKIPHELKPIFVNKENERNYLQLKKRLGLHYAYARVLGTIIDEAEEFQRTDIPPLVINGVDLVDLDKELDRGTKDENTTLFKLEKVFCERSMTIRRKLLTLCENEQGTKWANEFVKTYVLDDNPQLMKSFERWGIQHLLAVDITLVKNELLNNTSMETTNVNVDEKELQRITESLKYSGLKDVPKELVIDMLVKDQDKSVINWETKEDSVTSNVDMYFKKANNKQYLNGFAVALSQDGKQFFRRYNRIDFGNTLTYKQTLNMAQRRAIGRDWFEKDENGKVGERYFATAMFDFNDKDDKGNPKVVKYHNYDAPGKVGEYPIDFTASEKAKEYFLENLMRGNLTDCSLITEAGNVPVKVYMNPRENKLVFLRDGKEVDISVKDNVATIRDINLQAEKKNDLNQGRRLGQGTGRGENKDKEKPGEEGTTKRTPQMKM